MAIQPRISLVCTAVALLALCATGACARRTLEVTSDPPGALVWINDQEVGRTPLEAEFKYFGVYDVRAQLEGYETVHEGRKAQPPIWEQPGVDLLLAGAGTRTRVAWHIVLTPLEAGDKQPLRDALVERAKAFGAGGAPR